MTLIVGIKCEGGVVLAADGAATLGALGHTTVRQETKKLEILEDCIVVGTSGPVGLGQRIRGEIRALWNKKSLSGVEPYQAMAIMRAALWQHVQPELQAAAVAQQVVGGNVAAQSAICSSVVALPIGKTPCLFQFDQQCAPEEATGKLLFVSTGSGQQIADPFLAFVRRIFWHDRIPTVEEGVFAALWTLNHAIVTNPGGISEPVQMIVLDASPKCKARELQKEELQEHEEAISYAEECLAKFRESFHNKEGDASQPPPVPEKLKQPLPAPEK
jgi:hypothetical protein